MLCYVYLTEHIRLLHTFVVDTLLNFPMPFNIILTYPNTFHVNALRLLFVFFCGGRERFTPEEEMFLKIASF